MTVAWHACMFVLIALCDECGAGWMCGDGRHHHEVCCGTCEGVRLPACCPMIFTVHLALSRTASSASLHRLQCRMCAEIMCKGKQTSFRPFQSAWAVSVLGNVRVPQPPGMACSACFSYPLLCMCLRFPLHSFPMLLQMGEISEIFCIFTQSIRVRLAFAPCLTCTIWHPDADICYLSELARKVEEIRNPDAH